ncbi:hypothetical protein WR25_16271 [Diploscapter pachys]|uniref:Uncharacterized protein n=1 Tax=Diploscapter pachys TaxID=2018661 RepID=A0A2A2L8K9_9BILA|nr:hypothetical protein WR25_16271 [Diploscapter pachys]
MNSVVPGRCELMLRTPSPASAAIYQTPNMGNLHISTCNTSCYAPFALIPDSERHSICSNFNIRPNKIIVEESSNEDPDSDDLPSDAPPLPTSKAPSDEDFGGVSLS